MLPERTTGQNPVIKTPSKTLPSDKIRSTIFKRKAKTDPSFGCSPESRSLEMHLRLGAINLDKPSGPTSHEVVAWVKNILHVEKAGHSGTLDPKVTGILPVLLGDATRVMDTLLLAGKEYICLMHVHKALPRKRILEVCKEFEGPIYQKPPLKVRCRQTAQDKDHLLPGRPGDRGAACTDAGRLRGWDLHTQALL